MTTVQHLIWQWSYRILIYYPFMAVLKIGCAFWCWVLQDILYDSETGERYGIEYGEKSLKRKTEGQLKK